MKDFLITLFLGWLGIHRFMKKKYITGAIWLCSFGLFGMGWFVDTVVAFVKMLKGEQPISEMQQPNKPLTGYEPRKNSLSDRKYTYSQLEGMKKADILEMAAGLGYTMTTIERDSKDKIISDFMKQQEETPYANNMGTLKKWLIKTFDTEITGTFAKCDLDKSYDRAEIVCSLRPNSSLNLEYWEYKGEPAFYVCNRGLDAGCVPATISKILHDIYDDCELVVTLRGKANYNDHDDLIQKIRIDVYK